MYFQQRKIRSWIEQSGGKLVALYQLIAAAVNNFFLKKSFYIFLVSINFQIFNMYEIHKLYHIWQWLLTIFDKISRLCKLIIFC